MTAAAKKSAATKAAAARKAAAKATAAANKASVTATAARKAAAVRAAVVKPLAAAASLSRDDSNRLPRVAHNQAVGDFLGLGYDQRAVAEDGFLTIYNPPARGGNVLKSTPTDLVAPGPVQGGSQYFPGTLWNPWEQPAVMDPNQLAVMYLAWSPDGFYLAGAQNTGGFYDWRTIAQPYYNVLLYKLPADGSCASATCATWIWNLPRSCQVGINFFTMGVTALAVGTVQGKEYVALGTSKTNCQGPDYESNGAVDGVLVFPGEFSPAWPPAYFKQFYYSGGYITNTVTGLAWDTNGSGLLGIALAGLSRTIFAANFVPGSGFIPKWTYWDRTFNEDSRDWSASALSVAVTHRADGSTVFAYGMSDGSVKLFDPVVTSTTLLASSVPSPNPVDAVTFTDRTDGTTGLPDIVAVSSTTNSAQLLRYTGETTLKPQPVAPGGATRTDVGGIQSWFPGYKTGSLSVRVPTVRDEGEAITVSFASRANPAYGCWFAPAAPGRAAFPAGDVIIDPAVSTISPTYTIGGLTAGANGDCASAGITGQWAAYLVVAPVQRPADRTVVKIVVPRTGQPKVTTAGGSLAVTLSKVVGTTYALGSWQLLVSPQPHAAPPVNLSLKATRLSPAGTAQPVYRLDVPATTFSLPVSNPARISSIIPAYTVWGSPDDVNDVKLGALLPQGQPTRSTSGSVTLAPASFYWQNSGDPGDTPVNYIHIEVENLRNVGGSPSVRLASAPPPAAGHDGQSGQCVPDVGHPAVRWAGPPLRQRPGPVRPTDPAVGRQRCAAVVGSELRAGLLHRPGRGTGHRPHPAGRVAPTSGSVPTRVRTPTTGRPGRSCVPHPRRRWVAGSATSPPPPPPIRS